MKKTYTNFGMRTMNKAISQLFTAMKSTRLEKKEIEHVKKVLSHMLTICNKTLEQYNKPKQ